jgi:hypothetical protein
MEAFFRYIDSCELTREQGLAELTLRYFTSHGPATIKDFGWWSSLKVGDIKEGLEMVGSQLIEEEVDGVPHWFADSASVPEAVSPKEELLQPFDEYVVAYKDSRHVIDASGLVLSRSGEYPFAAAVVLDSQLVGRWKHTFTQDDVLVEAALYHPLDEAQTQALHTSVSRLGDFLGLRSCIETSVIPPPGLVARQPHPPRASFWSRLGADSAPFRDQNGYTRRQGIRYRAGMSSTTSFDVPSTSVLVTTASPVTFL